MPGTQAQNLQGTPKIDLYIILFIILNIYYILTDYVTDIPRVISQDSVLQADLSWHQVLLVMSTLRSFP